MRCLKLTLAYDGTSFVGWQRQSNGISIQQLIEGAFAPLAAGVPPDVAGASRTDAGVHATAQVASVRIESALDVRAIQRALNFRLPPEIRVMQVQDAAAGFHARFDATAKVYRYRIVSSPVLSPFDRWFAHHAPEARDLDAMQRAAALLIGRHDFSSFQAAGGEVADAIRTVRRLELCLHGGELTMEIEGDGFVRHMVRAIAGTLIEIGGGRRRPDEIPGILAARDRRAAGRTAPAAGLTLIEVQYGG
jgi:tRNA pseudouridine38-40 synthase